MKDLITKSSVKQKLAVAGRKGLDAGRDSEVRICGFDMLITQISASQNTNQIKILISVNAS